MLSIIQAAGWPIWPLILCSILALAFIIERFIKLKTSRVLGSNLVDEAIGVSRDSVPTPDTVNQLEQHSALGQVLAAGWRAINNNPRCTPTEMRAAMEAAGRSATHRLERYLPALATIASAAPLLGLLGTVIGMIDAFGSLAASQAAADPRMLASGIWTALTTTAAGLAIALVAYFIAAWLEGRIDDERQTIEMVISAAIHGRVGQTRG